MNSANRRNQGVPRIVLTPAPSVHYAQEICEEITPPQGMTNFRIADSSPRASDLNTSFQFLRVPVRPDGFSDRKTVQFRSDLEANRRLTPLKKGFRFFCAPREQCLLKWLCCMCVLLLISIVFIVYLFAMGRTALLRRLRTDNTIVCRLETLGLGMNALWEQASIPPAQIFAQQFADEALSTLRSHNESREWDITEVAVDGFLPEKSVTHLRVSMRRPHFVQHVVDHLQVVLADMAVTDEYVIRPESVECANAFVVDFSLTLHHAKHDRFFERSIVYNELKEIISRCIWWKNVDELEVVHMHAESNGFLRVAVRLKLHKIMSLSTMKNNILEIIAYAQIGPFDIDMKHMTISDKTAWQKTNDVHGRHLMLREIAGRNFLSSTDAETPTFNKPDYEHEFNRKVIPEEYKYGSRNRLLKLYATTHPEKLKTMGHEKMLALNRRRGAVEVRDHSFKRGDVQENQFETHNRILDRRLLSALSIETPFPAWDQISSPFPEQEYPYGLLKRTSIISRKLLSIEDDDDPLTAEIWRLAAEVLADQQDMPEQEDSRYFPASRKSSDSHQKSEDLALGFGLESNIEELDTVTPAALFKKSRPKKLSVTDISEEEINRKIYSERSSDGLGSSPTKMPILLPSHSDSKLLAVSDVSEKQNDREYFTPLLKDIQKQAHDSSREIQAADEESDFQSAAIKYLRRAYSNALKLQNNQIPDENTELGEDLDGGGLVFSEDENSDRRSLTSAKSDLEKTEIPSRSEGHVHDPDSKPRLPPKAKRDFLPSIYDEESEALDYQLTEADSSDYPHHYGEEYSFYDYEDSEISDGFVDTLSTDLRKIENANLQYQIPLTNTRRLITKGNVNRHSNPQRNRQRKPSFQRKKLMLPAVKPPRRKFKESSGPSRKFKNSLGQSKKLKDSSRSNLMDFVAEFVKKKLKRLKKPKTSTKGQISSEKSSARSDEILFHSSSPLDPTKVQTLQRAQLPYLATSATEKADPPTIVTDVPSGSHAIIMNLLARNEELGRTINEILILCLLKEMKNPSVPGKHPTLDHIESRELVHSSASSPPVPWTAEKAQAQISTGQGTSSEKFDQSTKSESSLIGNSGNGISISNNDVGPTAANVERPKQTVASSKGEDVKSIPLGMSIFAEEEGNDILVQEVKPIFGAQKNQNLPDDKKDFVGDVLRQSRTGAKAFRLESKTALKENVLNRLTPFSSDSHYHGLAPGFTKDELMRAAHLFPGYIDPRVHLSDSSPGEDPTNFASFSGPMWSAQKRRSDLKDGSISSGVSAKDPLSLWKSILYMKQHAANISYKRLKANEINAKAVGVDECPNGVCDCRYRVSTTGTSRPTSRVCDGIPDCPNGEDETGCAVNAATDGSISEECDSPGCIQCPPEYHYCRTRENLKDGDCFSTADFCNGKTTCASGRDEHDSLCTKVDDGTAPSSGSLGVRSSGLLYYKFRGVWRLVCDSPSLKKDTWADRVCVATVGSQRGTAKWSIMPVVRSVSGLYAIFDGSGWKTDANCKTNVINIICSLNSCGFIQNPLTQRFRRAATTGAQTSKALDSICLIDPMSPPKNGCSKTEHLSSARSSTIIEKGVENNDARIVGGHAASERSMNWIVSLTHNGIVFCSGTLLNLNWIVTAAHCFCVWANSRTKIDYKTVFYQACGGMTRLTSANPDMQCRDVSIIVVHELYLGMKQAVQPFHNDIALAKVSKPFYFNLAVNRLCLPERGVPIPDGLECIVAGWGALSFGNQEKPDHLQEVTVPLMANCAEYMPDVQKNIDKHFCAGYREGGKDSCTGDSGGPLVCPHHSGYVLFGITSYGKSCAGPKSPGVYTRVSNYVDWIMGVIVADGKGKYENSNYYSSKQCKGLRCSTGRCIKTKDICDGQYQCPADGEDENQMCDTRTSLNDKTDADDQIFGSSHDAKSSLGSRCSPGFRPCDSVDGGCVSELQLCDRKMDCSDKSDESRCTYSDYMTKSTDFQKYVCDGIQDTPDGSDEVGCSYSCQEGQKICPWSRSQQPKCVNVTDLINRKAVNCPGNPSWPYRFVNSPGIPVRVDAFGNPLRERYGIVLENVYPYSNKDWFPKCFAKVSQEVADLLCKEMGYYSAEGFEPVAGINGDTCNPGFSFLNLGCSSLSCGIREIHAVDSPLPGSCPWSGNLFLDGQFAGSVGLIAPAVAVAHVHAISSVDWSNISAVVYVGMTEDTLFLPKHATTLKVKAVRSANKLTYLELESEVSSLHTTRPACLPPKPLFSSSFPWTCEAWALDAMTSVLVSPCSEPFNASDPHLCGQLTGVEPPNCLHFLTGTVYCPFENRWYAIGVFKRDYCDMQKVFDLELITPQNMGAEKVVVKTPECENGGRRNRLGKCIKADLLCDGKPDSNDGIDEIDCAAKARTDFSLLDSEGCEPGLIQCSDGSCVKNIRGCPGIVECKYGKNDTECVIICGSGEYFKDPTKLCDGKIDCIDGSDEIIPKCGCGENQFRCIGNVNGEPQCINMTNFCDADVNCKDASDELHCMALSLDGIVRTNSMELPAVRLSSGYVFSYQGSWSPHPVDRLSNESTRDAACQYLGFDRHVSFSIAPCPAAPTHVGDGAKIPLECAILGCYN